MLTIKNVIISWKEKFSWYLYRNKTIIVWISNVWVIPIMFRYDKIVLKIVLITTVLNIKLRILSSSFKYWDIKKRN